MKSTILGTCAIAAVALVGFASPSMASPLTFSVNLGTDNDLAINEPVSLRKEGTIMEVLRNDKRFHRVVRALEESRGLKDGLDRRDSKITFLAPTDEAWKNIEQVLDSMRKNRENRDRNDRGNEREDMEKVLQYHILRDELNEKELFNGRLLETELRESELKDKRQKIRVVDFFGQKYLNMYARVHREELRADNGVILILDNVLCPPLEALEMMGNVPFAYSTMLVAAEKTDMLKRIKEEKGVTVFAPVNNAWKTLGIQNLIYLFSPHGEKDLKRIVQYHIGRETVYSTDMIKEKKMKIRTLLRDEELEINACEYSRGHKRDFADFKKEECPFEYIYTINKGEARIEMTCADFLAENGVIQAINSVLIPSDVKLPFAMSTIDMGLDM